jgi:hypothetical protein
LRKRYAQHARNSRVQLIVLLVIPMLLVSAGSIGFALTASDQTATIMNLSPADYEIEITDHWIKSYNGLGSATYENATDGYVYRVIFADDCVFPGWELNLITEIHNTGSDCNLNYTIYYSNQTDSPVWTQTDEAGLFNAVGMQYTSTFYLNKSLTDVMPPKWDVEPGDYVYHSDYLVFDPNGQFPQLEDKSFLIEIIVQAGPPDPTPYLNFGGT